MKITPVLIVEQIESSLPFWIDRLGFEQTVAVPDGDRLGFVILVRDGAELMLQTVASVNKDAPQFAPKGGGHAVALFIEVDDFSKTLQCLETHPVAMAPRTTNHGMREIGVFEPGGHTVVFAAKA